MATHDWDGNIGRLKPYLVEMEARLAAVEGRLPDPKEQARMADEIRAEVKAEPQARQNAQAQMQNAEPKAKDRS